MSGFDLIIQPDEEEAGAAEVLVDGRIGGRPYRFLLDTGAAKTHMVFDEYTSTFARIAQDTSSGVFTSQTHDVISVPILELGAIVRQDFPVVRMAEGAPYARNLIGMDLLKDFRCSFLFDEQHVAVDIEDDAGIEFQDLYLGSRFHPYIDVVFGAVEAKAIWDTGAGITVVDMAFIEKHPALFQEAGRSQGMDATGTELATPMFIMTEATMGNHSFPPCNVAGVDLSQVNATLILGYNTLSKANWIMDFRGRTWAIAKMLV